MDYKDKKIVVVGAGKSGIAAVNLLRKEGADVVLYDANRKLESGELMDKTGNADNVDIVFGEFPEELLWAGKKTLAVEKQEYKRNFATKFAKTQRNRIFCNRQRASGKQVI